MKLGKTAKNNKEPPIKGRYNNQPIPMNNNENDNANEKGNEVTPSTKTRRTWGLSSTRIINIIVLSNILQ